MTDEPFILTQGTINLRVRLFKQRKQKIALTKPNHRILNEPDEYAITCPLCGEQCKVHDEVTSKKSTKGSTLYHWNEYQASFI